MLGQISLFTLPGEVALWQKYQNKLFVAMWIWMFPLTYWILNFSFLFYVDCLNSCWSIVVKKCHRNTTHILDMSCCHKYQQQRHHHENTKICVFIHYIYVDILFPLTKAITTMFERVATYYQTLQTWIGHNATCYHNLNALPHALPHALPCIFSEFNLGKP